MNGQRAAKSPLTHRHPLKDGEVHVNKGPPYLPCLWYLPELVPFLLLLHRVRYISMLEKNSELEKPMPATHSVDGHTGAQRHKGFFSYAPSKAIAEPRPELGSPILSHHPVLSAGNASPTQVRAECSGCSTRWLMLTLTVSRT